jgi:hypothetical protein
MTYLSLPLVLSEKIGMPFGGEFHVGVLDLAGRGSLGELEDLVVVFERELLF